MASDMKYALRRAGLTWLTALAVIVGFGVVMTFGPTIEPAYWPVLEEQKVTFLEIKERTATFEIRVHKVRNCRLEDAGFVLRQGERINWVTVYRADGTPVGPGVSYDPGWLLLGPFHFLYPPGFVDPSDMYGVLYYDCHAGWFSRQILGPVKLR